MLSKLVYNLSLRTYYNAAYVFSFFNKKAAYWIQGRKIPIEQISQKSIWFHCASLGEFEQARPLIEYLKKEYPQFKIVLTFYSPSGYEIRKNYIHADYIYYLPLDTKKNAIHFIHKINPQMVFFVKYEFWYHFINQLSINNIPIFLVSGIFRKKQNFFQWHGSFFREILKNFTHLFVQDQASLELLKSIEIVNCSQANDSRFDRVFDIYKESKSFENIEKFVGNKACIILGSSWLEDEKIFNAILPKIKNYKLIIAPHNINKKRIQEVKELFTDNILYSQLTQKSTEHQVLIIDNIGMLSSIYKYGTIAYIGGGFGVSIHNILEAVVYSIPAIFGPAHTKMKEASDLIKNGGGFEINNLKELETILEKLKDKDFLLKSSKIAGNYVQSNTGGTEKILSFLKKEKMFEKMK